MTDLAKFTDEEIRAENSRRHCIEERFSRAADLVRAAVNVNDKMTRHQASKSCEYIAEALKMTREQFGDAILAHAGCSNYYRHSLDKEEPAHEKPQHEP